ncbi:hypothetical protein [Gordonia westfalica]|uniref:Uncharacterized protein n=1 Tax=Gordonia westfalica TaxID=158898 RepID=A0A1H2DS40_9ACTN|nr:hypothetical protein [Gordonia westfalica]SDT85687.1 hypothetical protein SAMN04488548_12047 [Gordonia westfalica]
MSRPICGVCGFDLGYGHMVRMRWETAPATSSHARIAWPITTLKTSSGDTPMSNGFHIEPSTTRMDQGRRSNTLDEKKQALGSSNTFPGANVLNRNRNVSDLPKPPAWHEGAPAPPQTRTRSFPPITG